jgi:murein DD-endopeptidase MepM/ murein hydrolase activator NlpD
VVKADSEYNTSGSYIFDLNKNLGSTLDLAPDIYFSNIGTENKKQKKSITTVNALKIDTKTIVIKGYNEDVDNILLNTINIESENIDTITPSYGADIMPITIDLALDDEVVQLSGDGGDILEYEVVSGDNLSSIAEKFNITVDTILWANDLNSKSSIKVGQKLVILPVSGISYKVKSGDTVSGLAAKFNVPERDIVGFNKTEDNKLIIGESIVIPGAKVTTKNTNTVKNVSKPNNSSSKQSAGTGSMVKPIGHGSVKTQGIHGHNGVDFGAPIGTAVYAAMDGVVTLTRGGGGWNGGYGNYIVIKHANGVQTLYAHLDSISVNKGDNVNKSQVIGRSGNSGKSTGPHLHFEVRGARNPF